MADNSDHTAIDVKNLATSLRGDLEKLNPLTDNCCIYKVPPNIRRLNEGLFTPDVVSIGPLHHGREELKAMEEHKKRYLQDFLNRTGVSLEDLIVFIKDREARLRNCYSETIWLESDDFVKIILVDAVFVLELLPIVVPGSRNSDYRIFTKPRKIYQMAWDLLLLENQLPFFILEDLFGLAKTACSVHYEEISVPKLTRELWKPLGKSLLIDDNLLEVQFPEAEHVLDLIRLCLRPSESREGFKELKTLTTPTITELHQAGVKFKMGSSNHLFDIRFKNGILEIPQLKVYLRTESFFRNLQVFERLHAHTNHVNDYIIIMTHLVNAPKDVELLVQNGIIENWLWDSEGVSTLFHNLLKESNILKNNFYYSDLIEDLTAYCRSPWHKWKASLKQNYFNTPWASISVIAAVILLLLTFIQTVSSVFSFN